MNRRQLAVAAVGAGLAGVGAAWWRYRPAAVLNETEAAFWATVLERPEGGEPLALASFRGRPLLVNFWATWCPPCVEELPLLNAFYRQRSREGWQVVGLAVDQSGPVRDFLQKLPLAFPVGMAGFAGTDLARSLGNPSGGLPYTVVFGAAGTVVHQKLGKVSAEDLAQWAQLG